MITVYGIKNCDTVKRARKTLEAEGIAFHYHDFRSDGLARGTLERWMEQLGADALMNRRGTTWRKLDEQQRAATDPATQIALMMENPSLIKRPVFENGDEVRLGFARKDEAEMLSWLRA